MRIVKVITYLAVMAFLASCGKEGTDPVEKLQLFSITANGATLTDGTGGLPTGLQIVLTFSASLDQDKFRDATRIVSGFGEAPFDVSFSNNSSRATLDLSLDFDTEYTLEIQDIAFGANGQRLENAIRISFFTRENDLITALPPCTNTNDCMQSVLIEGSAGMGAFSFFGNYPIYEDKARWMHLTRAVIVVHGASINPDTYYGYLTNALGDLGISDSTVLLAPFFRTETTGDENDFYWSTPGWREGRDSRNANKLSSFEAVDQLISRLADPNHFPVLDQVIIVGQSSGGLFTHLYAPSNKSEEKFPDIEFSYLVSESQYFYYPDEQRIDESTNQLYTPTGCTGYDIWPFGFNVVPDYLADDQLTAFNDRFVNRRLTYILGNGSGTDNALNTEDCGAVLLGPSRYQRGEHIFRYMDLKYPAGHNHQKLVVPGVAHDGAAIFQSQEFRDFLIGILQE